METTIDDETQAGAIEADPMGNGGAVINESLTGAGEGDGQPQDGGNARWAGAVKAAVDIVTDGERQVIARISDQSVDSDREVMLAAGMSAPQSHLPVLFGHNASDPSMVLGKTLWIRKNPRGATANEIIAKIQFNETPNGKLVYELLKNGDITTFSHRFTSDDSGPPTEDELRKNPGWAAARWVHRKWRMREVSVVPVPANENAVALSIAKGLDDCEVGQWIKSHSSGPTGDTQPDQPTKSGEPRGGAPGAEAHEPFIRPVGPPPTIRVVAAAESRPPTATQTPAPTVRAAADMAGAILKAVRGSIGADFITQGVKNGFDSAKGRV